MKKLSILTVLSFLLLHCQKEETPLPPPPPDDLLAELLSINVPDDYYVENSTEDYGTGHVFLTDENGEIIADSPLSNGSNITLTEEFDYENNSYDLTILNKRVHPTGTTYRLMTFQDIEPFELNFTTIEDLNPNGEQATITINNAPEFLSPFISNQPFDISSTSGNAKILKATLKQIPDDIFAYFQNSDDDLRRYLWLENVDAGSNYAFQFDQIPVVDNEVVFNFPQSDNLSVDIDAAKATAPLNFHSLSFEYDISGSESITCHIPSQNIFDIFKIRKTVGANDGIYQTLKISNSMDLGFTIPNLDLEIINDSQSNYEATTSNNYDFYNVSYTFYESTEGYSVTWSIKGERAETINFSLPDLINIVFVDHPDFDYDDLEILGSNIVNYDEIISYEQYIDIEIDGIPAEGVTIEYLEAFRK